MDLQDRQWDLFLGDNIEYDEKIGNVVTDYVDLARRLKKFGSKERCTQKEIDYILERFTSNMNTKEKSRRFRELLETNQRVEEYHRFL